MLTSEVISALTTRYNPVPVRYCCRNCGYHFDGRLHVLEKGNTVCFIHDHCPFCHVSHNSPYIEPGGRFNGFRAPIPFENYVSSVRRALGEKNQLVQRLQKIQEMHPRIVKGEGTCE